VPVDHADLEVGEAAVDPAAVDDLVLDRGPGGGALFVTVFGQPQAVAPVGVRQVELCRVRSGTLPVEGILDVVADVVGRCVALGRSAREWLPIEVTCEELRIFQIAERAPVGLPPGTLHDPLGVACSRVDPIDALPNLEGDPAPVRRPGRGRDIARGTCDAAYAAQPGSVSLDDEEPVDRILVTWMVPPALEDEFVPGR
jgi:hypothetical protein